MRNLRSNGTNIKEFEAAHFTEPFPWKGKRWTLSVFKDEKWRWGEPSRSNKLHVLVYGHARRIRMDTVVSHEQSSDLPAGSILCLDECASIVSPEYLFLQMASCFSFPALVLLGYELCGHFSRDAQNPIEGPVAMELPQATSVESISSFIASLRHVPGVVQARAALQYISDHAASAPEALLASVYSLPPEECGYGFGPVVLNTRVPVSVHTDGNAAKNRHPDIMFPFGPLGINYEGENHFDLSGIVVAAQKEALSLGNDAAIAGYLEEKLKEVRAKYVDDILRNRQLAASGKVVFPVTKEDLYGVHSLDNLTRHILASARSLFHIDTEKYDKVLESTELARDRYDLLSSFLPFGRKWDTSHGKL